HRLDQRQLLRVLALPDVSRNRLVVGEVGQAVAAVQVGGAQVDPELAGDRAVDRAGPAVRGRRTGLFLGRQAAYLDVAAHERVERLWQTTADVGEAIVDEGENLLAARVAVGELVSRVRRQRLHPLADRALRVAD